jgi:hypothetical protein
MAGGLKERKHTQPSFKRLQATAPAIVALSGVIALLGFYSANYSRMRANPPAMDAFGEMLLWLFTCQLRDTPAWSFCRSPLPVRFDALRRPGEWRGNHK